MINGTMPRYMNLMLAGGIQPAEFDFGNQINTIAGYKSDFGLAVSSRFKFSKGRPYTPFDVEMSKARLRGIYDISLYNEARMPDYSRVDLRIEYLMELPKLKLQVYLEVLNVFNRKNYFSYYWSNTSRGPRPNLQIPRIPVLGFSFQF